MQLQLMRFSVIVVFFFDTPLINVKKFSISAQSMGDPLFCQYCRKNKTEMPQEPESSYRRSRFPPVFLNRNFLLIYDKSSAFK